MLALLHLRHGSLPSLIAAEKFPPQTDVPCTCNACETSWIRPVTWIWPICLCDSHLSHEGATTHFCPSARLRILCSLPFAESVPSRLIIHLKWRGRRTGHIRVVAQSNKINILDLTKRLQNTNLQLQAINGYLDTECDQDGWSTRAYLQPYVIESLPSTRESSCWGFHHWQMCDCGSHKL